jgi:hypothetical protein
MTTFPGPKGCCAHGKRLALHGQPGEPCHDCSVELAAAKLDDEASRERIQGPYRSDGMPWVER